MSDHLNPGEREAFETWWRTNGENNQGIRWVDAIAWKAWQARAALSAPHTPEGWDRFTAQHAAEAAAMAVGPVVQAVVPPHTSEAVERAFLTLRGITQEIRGRGISAVMTLEEQIRHYESAAPVVEVQPEQPEKPLGVPAQAPSGYPSPSAPPIPDAAGSGLSYGDLLDDYEVN